MKQDEVDREYIAAGTSEAGPAALTAAGWVGGLAGGWLLRPGWSHAAGADQDGHRDRHHRPDRGGGQFRLAGRAVYGRADQQERGRPGPAHRALSGRHRFRSEDRGRQCAQADPGAQGRRGAGRHHQRHAAGDQGPDRQPGPHALHLSAALRGQGVHEGPVLHWSYPGAAMRQADPLFDQDGRAGSASRCRRRTMSGRNY